MKKILFVILAGLLILSTFTAGCGGPCVMEVAPIHGIDIWADESLPPQYFLYVVTGQRSSCVKFYSYNVTRAGNTTIIVEILNRNCGIACADEYSFAENTIPLSSDFVPGGNYTVEVNNMTVTFVAGVIMIYPAPIVDVEIWVDGSSPPQYFVDVVSEEPTTCDHFDSYNVTRAGNTTILVEVFNRRCCTGCPDGWYWDEYRYVEHTIPLGSDFVPGGNYTVEANDVTETFVAQ
jgi:hypothetical protein